MEKLTRKDFLKKMGLIGLSGTALLAACGGESTTPPPPAATPAPSAPAPTPESAAVDCSAHNAQLTPQDQALRSGLGYVEKSATAGQKCSNCKYWQPDKVEGECGGCQLFTNGAVTPEGWCKSWMANG